MTFRAPDQPGPAHPTTPTDAWQRTVGPGPAPWSGPALDGPGPDPWTAPAMSVLAAAAPAGRPHRSLPVIAAAAAALVVLGLGTSVVVLRHSGTSAPSAVPGPVTPTAAPPAGTAGGSGGGSGSATRPGPAAGKLVVTPAAARAVVAAYWPVHSRALLDRDYPTLSTLASRQVRRWEVGSLACGCQVVTHLRPLDRVQVAVPRQTTYPARFLAAVDTTDGKGQDSIQILVFERHARRSPWLVVEDSVTTPLPGAPDDLMTPRVDDQGFTRRVDPVAHDLARTLAGSLAGIWQSAKETGQLPDPASRTFYRRGMFQLEFDRFAEHRQDTVHSNGLYGHAQFRAVATDPFIAVPMRHGVTLACQPVHQSQLYYTDRGGYAFQDQAQENWGPFLAPGRYPALRSERVWQTCFAIYDDYDGVDLLVPDFGGGFPVPAARPAHAV